MFKRILQQQNKSLKSTIKFKNYVKNTSDLNVRPTESIQLFDTEAQPITTDEIFADDQNVAVFGVPGAFTPTCSLKHVNPSKKLKLTSNRFLLSLNSQMKFDNRKKKKKFNIFFLAEIKRIHKYCLYFCK